MFLHLYKYRLKCFLHEKENIFWSLLFPLILCLCFVVGFSGVTEKAYTFHTIPVAIVYEQENEIFKTTIDAIASDTSQGEPFLAITETDYENAATLLSDKTVAGIIMVKDDISLIVNDNSISQTALQSFINQYTQKADMFEKIAKTNPEALRDLAGELSDNANYIRDKNFTQNKMDPMASYYFSLIAFSALCGGFFGLNCARQLRANATAEGMRKSISSVPRSLFITAEFLATYTIHLAIMIILILVMVFVYRIDLGNQAGYVALTAAAGSLCGTSIGLFTGSLKVKEAFQITLFIVISLVSSFLSGLMIADMKMIIEEYAPVINRINPSSLIADALYSLTIYETHERYFTNIITLVIISVVFLVASILMTRRERHASI